MSEKGHERWLAMRMTTSDLPRQADQYDARPDFAVGPKASVCSSFLRFRVSAGRWDQAAKQLTVGANNKATTRAPAGPFEVSILHYPQ